MSEANERSVASNGSVAGEPVAWAVLDSRGTVCLAYTCREAAEAYCEVTFNRLAPLYRQPHNGVVRLPPLDPNGAPGWNAAIRERDEARAEVERLKAELAARRSMAPVVDAGGGGAGVSWCRGSVRGGAVNDPEFDRMARVVSLWVFVAAVVGGLAVGIWSALEIFVLFDGNFRR